MSELKQKTDPFFWSEIYPDPSEIFGFKNKSIDDIYKSADIVLDTNILLFPFSTGSKSIKEVKKIYTKLIEENRLYVPAQAAREFAKNRPDKINNLYHQLNQKKQTPIKKSFCPLFEGIEEYIKIEEQEDILLLALAEYSKRISKMQAVIKDWGCNDPVSKMYREIGLGDRIIKSKIDQKILLDSKEKRYLHKIPPGYKDSNKDDGGIGDYLIWEEILSLGKENKKDLIFVTGEEKSDWWSKSSGSELHVRHELIDEYRRNSNSHSFQIINFPSLLELFKAEIDVVDQAKAIEMAASEDSEDVKNENVLQSGPQSLSFKSFAIAAESAVKSWVKSSLSIYIDRIILESKLVDFIAEGANGSIGYEVRAIRHVQHIRRRIQEYIPIGRKFLSDKRVGYSGFRLVFVTETLADALHGSSFVKNIDLEINFGFIIGYLDQDSVFNSVYRSYGEDVDEGILLF